MRLRTASRSLRRRETPLRRSIKRRISLQVPQGDDFTTLGSCTPHRPRGSPVADTAARILGNSGGKRLRTAEEIEATIKAVPQEDRQTLQSLEASSGIKKTTIIRHMKEKMKLKGRSNYVKPLLTDANKITRLRYALNILLPGSNGTHFFDNMYNRVHIDEKWFFLTKVKRRFYVYSDEDVALRA
ncbi:Aste57867_17900 [Aphanomyces stellatus]|uniref:Aste57867_17900 protein n=1 Tax=Aphanomyces stellatus TaxID=120398 RepID=A0A485L8P9_9STRA|nr:hypothetical protein As57867_017839 [Aphanomyces stellatus]VFT94642.1 Aste57867_17900 [Aphanomyces stellatus]